MLPNSNLNNQPSDAASLDTIAMKPVSFRALDGQVRQVTPVSPYTFSSTVRTHDFIDREYLDRHFATAPMKFETLDEVMSYSLQVIASSPDFLPSASIHWLLAYVSHIQELLPKEPGGPTRGFTDRGRWLSEALYERGDFIYATRMVGALQALECIWFGGYGGSVIFDTSPLQVHLRLDALVDEDNTDVLRPATAPLRSFDDRAYKAQMTRNFASGVSVQCAVPDGEEMAIYLRSEEPVVWGAGVPIPGEIKRFHLTGDFWANAPFVAGERRFVDPDRGFHVFEITHPVAPYEDHPTSDEFMDSTMQGVALYIPHEWITGTNKYGVFTEVDNHRAP